MNATHPMIGRFEGMDTIDGVIPERLENATLVSADSTVMGRKTLRTLATPEGTGTFKPIPHIELIESLDLTLRNANISIVAEKFAINRGGNALFGVMDLEGLATPAASGFRAAMAIRTSNDKTMSLQLGVGAKVFICDNLALHADLIALKRKHTNGLDLMSELKDALDRYITQFYGLSNKFNELKNTWLSDDRARIIIYDLFAKETLSVRYFQAVNQTYFNPTGGAFAPEFARTSWALHNTFTYVLKAAPLGVQQRATQELAAAFQLK